MTAVERRLAAANLIIALVALFGGVVTGFFQALEYAGIDVYPSLAPVIRSYYHSLSIHGVLNALVFTTFFICGFLPFMTSRALSLPLASPRIGWLTFWLMAAGLVLASIPLVGNAATVMFTFYPPLKAHWAFYIGLTLVVAGTWLVTLNLALTWRAWRARNPGTRTPLAAFMSLVTFAMWTIASVGLAAEMLVLTIPWSLGIVGRDRRAARPDPLLVHRPRDRLLLAPARVRVLVHPGAAAGGRQAPERSDGAHLLHPVPAPLHADRHPSPVRGPGHPPGMEAPSRPAHVRGILSEPAHVLQRRRVARDRRPGSGRNRVALVVPPTSVGRPLAGRAGAGHGALRLRWRRRPHPRLVQRQPRGPQHGVRPRPPAPDGRQCRDAHVRRHHLLARTAPGGTPAVEPKVRPRPGLALGRRRPALFPGVARARTARHAAPDHDRVTPPTCRRTGRRCCPWSESEAA